MPMQSNPAIGIGLADAGTDREAQLYDMSLKGGKYARSFGFGKVILPGAHQLNVLQEWVVEDLANGSIRREYVRL